MEGYYDLDSQAEILCAEMDKLLLEAEKYADATVVVRSDITDISGGDDIQGLYYSNLFSGYYLAEAETNLNQWAAFKPEVEVRGSSADLEVIFNLTEGDPFSEVIYQTTNQSRVKNLTVVLKLNKPVFRSEQTPTGLLYYREDNYLKRFTIAKWQQWQEPLEFQDLEFWDGIIPE
jgi:hypothetical protein